MIESVRRSGAQGEFGHAVPVRPARDRAALFPAWCLRGHELKIAGAGRGWSHFYNLPRVTCQVCYDQRDPAASWCLIEPADQYPPDKAPQEGLKLHAVAPLVRGGIGRIELHLDGHAVGDLDLAACGPCRRAVIEQLRVDHDHRRLGYGRILIAAALSRAPADKYDWSTTKITDTVETRAFWAASGFPGTLGQPQYCTDMLRAAQKLP
ncbi:GNAT family N-acetyltransferase [Amycolatopsis nigrescens]|uniref:GNAT family N-acetyltransferase n=1 Tax=Amycolatopsis nigrescens TaxID=381445 RepID=UPI00036434AC|nr:GNAT family N-acetyltransferase [Amycolatopsis nigrescens]